jgi:N-acetylneuraminic acid mutarotase
MDHERRHDPDLRVEERTMTRIQVTIAPALLLAIASLMACGEHSSPLAPEAPTAESLDSQTLSAVSNSWANSVPMPTKRRALVAATVKGTIYAIGGQKFLVAGDPDDATEVNLTKVEAFNTSSGTWATKASLPSARAWPSGAAVINGKIYVPGGVNANGIATKTLYVFNPTTNTWSTKAPLPVASARGAAVAIGGKLWVVTPAAGSTHLHRYDPSTNTWTALASGPAGYYYPVAGVIDGKIYVTGTMSSNNSPSLATSVYDPATNAWASRDSRPSEQIGAGGQVIGNKLYVVGGSFVLNNIEHGGLRVYDPATDYWTYPYPKSMPAARTFLAVAVANGKLYALGGSKYPEVLGTNQVYTP